MNKVIIVGHLTKDPELRYPSSNVPVANFTVAVNRPFANQEGVREADFINVIVWRKQAENVKKYTTKGSLIGVEGRIQTRNYTANDGTKRYITEVVADSVQFLGSKKDNQVGYQSAPSYDYVDVPTVDETPTVNVENDPYVDFGANIEITDDLPF